MLISHHFYGCFKKNNNKSKNDNKSNNKKDKHEDKEETMRYHSKKYMNSHAGAVSKKTTNH